MVGDTQLIEAHEAAIDAQQLWVGCAFGLMVEPLNW